MTDQLKNQQAYEREASQKPLANWQAALMFIVFFGVISTPVYLLS